MDIRSNGMSEEETRIPTEALSDSLCEQLEYFQCRVRESCSFEKVVVDTKLPNS